MKGKIFVMQGDSRLHALEDRRTNRRTSCRLCSRTIPISWPAIRWTATHRTNSEEVLATFLETDAEGEASEFWTKVKTNLQAGKVRLVFVADGIPPELRRIVEFLNEQMVAAEVLAVEVRQYRGDGLRTLVPRVYGKTGQSIGRQEGGQIERKAILGRSVVLRKATQSRQRARSRCGSHPLRLVERERPIAPAVQ